MHAARCFAINWKLTFKTVFVHKQYLCPEGARAPESAYTLGILQTSVFRTFILLLVR